MMTPPDAIPDRRDLLRRAWAHQRAGRLPLAAQQYRQLLDANPRDPAALFGLGQVTGNLGNLDEAIRLLEAAIDAGGMLVEKHVQLARFLYRAGRIEESIARAQGALALDETSVEAMCSIANGHERMNRLDAGVAVLERAIAIDPEHVNATLSLARLRRRGGEPAVTRGLCERMLERELRPYYRQLALNELAFALEALGDGDGAFDAHAERNAAQALDPTMARQDRELLPALVDAYAAAVTPALVDRVRAGSFDDPAPIFLVGFPRSGTTLTEQVLAAHGSVVTGDELPVLWTVREQIARSVGGLLRVPAALAELAPERIRDLRALYWQEATRATGADLTGRTFVDKQPFNLVDLGLINAIFPDARVIHVIRDPRDACLSCFKQWFRANHGTVHFLTLESTAALYRKVLDLWLHQRPILSLRLLEVRYEDAVRDLETQARRIIDLLGVAWDDGILRFHEAARDRFISTPSYVAVSEPVSSAPIGRWERLEARMAPVLDTLRPYVEALGYAAEGDGGGRAP